MAQTNNRTSRKGFLKKVGLGALALGGVSAAPQQTKSASPRRNKGGGEDLPEIANRVRTAAKAVRRNSAG